MATNFVDQNLRKDQKSKITRKTIQMTHSDEIALRDEILDLKRQIMILKRTNEQNLVKFRKYEDEAKRKDRQIEQLMDPRKNADITKNLSTKGAAILMNLKDQNNSLIQIVLNKDLQIRRLMSDIKMSKLYAASRKGDPYRAEISRLRSLVMKSQEMLKENMNLQHQQKEVNLINVKENSLLEMSFPSTQSTPRELEELRYTIQSLEKHIKYSNDLLVKKNHEIMMLSDELITLRRILQIKANQNGSHLGYKRQECFGQEFLNITHRQKVEEENSILTSAFERKNFEDNVPKNFIIPEKKKLHSSPPPNSPRWTENDSKTHHFLYTVDDQFEDNSKDENGLASIKDFEEHQEDHPSIQNLNQINTKVIPELRISLLPNSPINEIHDEENLVSEIGKKKDFIKEKWQILFRKYREYKNKREIEITKEESVRETGDEENDGSDLETHEFEMMEKEIQNDYCEEGKIFKFKEIDHCEEIKEINLETSDIPKTQRDILSIEAKIELVSTDVSQVPDESKSRTELNEQLTQSEDNLKLDETKKNDEMIISNKEELDQKYAADETPIKTSKNVPEDYDVFNQDEKSRSSVDNNVKKGKSLRDVYRQSLDSSFESENSYQVNHMQVEVQINSVPTHDDSLNFSENSTEINFGSRPDIGTEDEDDFNDDDDVVIR